MSSVTPASQAAAIGDGAERRRSAALVAPTTRARDVALRLHYATAGLAAIPRLLGAVDRCPFRPTYGCFDREFWHYRTSDFPCEMYQEGVLPLALAFAHEFPGNRWQGEERVRELVIAGIRFAARSSRRDGSCDDYYPFERALGAAVFSFVAATESYELLRLDDPEILQFFERRADWLARHDESGRLANHQALAARALATASRLLGRDDLVAAAQTRVERVLSWQSPEGWFDEYGGADPGYQTVTIDALVALRPVVAPRRLDDPLRQATAFARNFLYPDHSYGGEIGSRGTYHFYPHGFERLAASDANAADLADGGLQALALGRHGHFSDDRLFAHYPANFLEAYRDWSPERPDRPGDAAPGGTDHSRRFVEAALIVETRGDRTTVASLARGGAFKHFAGEVRSANDAGIVLETTDGRVAASQLQNRERPIAYEVDDYDRTTSATVSGPLTWVRCETATPTKLIVFRLLLLTIGRFFRTFVRRLLQRRLITGRRPAPIEHRRTLTFLPDGGLQVADELELRDARITIARAAFGSDHQTVYTAATGVYQDAVLTPWTELPDVVAKLNRDRRIVINRTWPGDANAASPAIASYEIGDDDGPRS